MNYTLKDNSLLVHFIDVGQGDSILIQHNGINMLIDAGPAKSNLIQYLKSLKLKKIDYLIETHPHEDHIGEMSSLINKFEVSKFYAPYVTTNTISFKNMISSLKRKNLKIHVAKPDINFDLGRDINCVSLAPNGDKYDNLNNYSCVIRLVFSNTSFLFTGDCENEGESEILNNYSDVSANVLKVGHHGSKTATSDAFLTRVNPQVAVISCGKNNDYGHPHSQTIKKLQKLKCKVYRTDIDGTIIIKSDGNTISRIYK